MKDEEYYKIVKSALKHYNYSYTEDILQELVIFLYQKLEDYDETRGEITTYAYAIVKNKYLQLKYNQKKRINYSSLDKIISEQGVSILDIIKDDSDLEENCYKERVLNLIKPMVKPALQLWLEGYTQQQIADKLGVKFQTIVSKQIKENILEIREWCKNNDINLGGNK